MEGLLLKLTQDKTGRPGYWFWQLFEPIRQDLDRLFWCFPNQPWFGSPLEFTEDDSATMSFEGEGTTSVMLWCPRTLGRYAELFAEEFIGLWGIEPTPLAPRRIAAEYSAAAFSEMDSVIEPHAQVWLLYTDSTCWEIYTRQTHMIDAVRNHLAGKPWVQAFDSKSDQRHIGFRSAGLLSQWFYLNGDTEPGAEPNGGPAMPSGNSEATGGPPSMS